MATFNPYLHYQGNAQEAFDLYKSVFGGEFEMRMQYKDAPPEAQNEHTKSNPDWIMHMALKTDIGLTIQGSDRPTAYGPVSKGDGFFINLNVDSVEQAKTIYEGLSKGGHVFMPLEKAFWAELFAMFSDKFGVQWMINFNG
ncbi:MAG: VOC family protein [Bacteroidetes bacterium]|nr:VOC family protein [Bacteroidota bacterium]